MELNLKLMAAIFLGNSQICASRQYIFRQLLYQKCPKRNRRLLKEWKMVLVVWVRRAHRGSLLNVWFLVGGTLGKAWLEDVCHWGQALRFQKTIATPCVLCLPPTFQWRCKLSTFPAAFPSLCRHGPYPSETISQIQHFLCKFPWSPCFATAIEK